MRRGGEAADGRKGIDCVGMAFMDVELVVGEGMWWVVSLAFVVSHPLCISLTPRIVYVSLLRLLRAGNGCLMTFGRCIVISCESRLP